MTYDPDRDAKAPLDVNPNQRRDFPDKSSRSGMLLGLLALLLIGGFIWYTMSDTNPTVATKETRPAAAAPSTTGSAPRETTSAPMPAQRPATPAPAPK